jgi:hypothetical protein
MNMELPGMQLHIDFSLVQNIVVSSPILSYEQEILLPNLKICARKGIIWLFYYRVGNN